MIKKEDVIVLITLNININRSEYFSRTGIFVFRQIITAESNSTLS